MELGGNAPSIVFDDADLEAAVVIAKFLSTGAPGPSDSAGVGVFSDERGLNVDEIRLLGRALVHRLGVVSFRQRESSGQVGPVPTANHLDAALGKLFKK